MRSEFKSATQIYVNPIHFEIQLIYRNYLFFAWWPKLMKKEKLPEILSWGNFCIVEFKSATQIYVNTIYFEIQLILKTGLFRIHGPDDQNWWNRKNFPKFFHRVIFAFWIQICNPNLCNSHIFWNTANIENLTFFRIPGHDDQNRWNRKNCPKFFHRVIFAFWIQICNPNLCKSHIFWITGNNEKWSFFAYPDLMTKIDEIGKIAQNSFVG